VKNCLHIGRHWASSSWCCSSVLQHTNLSHVLGCQALLSFGLSSHVEPAVLCRDGGIFRFYQGVGPALLQVGWQGLAAAAVAQPGGIAIISTIASPAERALWLYYLVEGSTCLQLVQLARPQSISLFQHVLSDSSAVLVMARPSLLCEVLTCS
jgi:hypothetical protein